MFRTIGFRFSGTAVSPHKNIQLNNPGLITPSVRTMETAIPV